VQLCPGARCDALEEAAHISGKGVDRVLDNVIRVLSIEDSRAQAELVQEMLTQATHEVPQLPYFEVIGEQRLETAMLRLDAMAIDVVLSDLDLPDSPRTATYQRLREHAPDLPIVVLTGCDDEQMACQMLRAGADDYLVKRDMTPLLLARAVTYAIERRRSQLALRQSHTTLEQHVELRTRKLEQVNPTARAAIRETNRLTKKPHQEMHWQWTVFDCFPFPMLVIDRRRIVLAANPAAQRAGARVDDYCWRRFTQSRVIPPADLHCVKERNGDSPPKTTPCSFCRADEALEHSRPVAVRDCQLGDRLWDLWWSRLERGVFLHFLVAASTQ